MLSGSLTAPTLQMVSQMLPKAEDEVKHSEDPRGTASPISHPQTVVGH